MERTYSRSELRRAAAELSVKIDNFAEEYDTYDYYDVVDDRFESIVNVARALMENTKYVGDIMAYLTGVIEDDCWYADKAKILLNELKKFKLKYHGC